MNKTPAAIVIRDIDGIAELRDVEELQKQIWGVADREVLPALAMIPMMEVGAVLIGAFTEGRMVGFVFGFPGQEDGRLILHSDMLAVLPEFRSYGLGYQLKLAQRERALAAGIDTITWTFDPLQSLNAHLNFSKLGVTSDRYLVDYYGETTSFLHSTGTDRLWVRWELSSKRVAERLALGRVPNESTEGIPVLLSVGEGNEPSMTSDGSTDALFLEIPGEISRIQKENVELALRWRAATREAFTRSFARGLFVEDFFLIERNKQKVGRYLLTG